MHRYINSGSRRRPFSFFWSGTLLFTLVLLLAACGNGDTGSSASASTSTPTAASSDVQPTPTAGVTPTEVVATPTSAATGPTKNVTLVSTGTARYGFMPATLMIKVGTTVIWKNLSQVPHTVTSDDGQTFASNALNTNDTFSFTFTKAGTYKYHCEFHPYMVATVIVEA